MAKQEVKTKRTQLSSREANGDQLEQTITVDDNCLPSPAELAQYQQLDPNIIPFLIETTKKEQEFRHKHEANKLKIYDKTGRRDFRLDMLGMLLAALIMFAGIGLAALLIYYEKIVTGSIFGGTTLIIAASIFIQRSKPAETKQNKSK